MSESPPSATEQPSEPLSQLERFLSVDPGNERLFTQCAALAVQLGDFEALLRAANTRLRLRPLDVAALSARAKALLVKGEFQHAVAEFEKVAVARSGDASIQQDLGLCYYRLGELEWARPAFEAAWRLGERNAELLRLLVSTWHQLGLLSKAEEECADADTVQRVLARAADRKA